MTVIRPADPGEAEALSALALRSKGYWGYDDDFLAACAAELTVSPAQIGTELVAVCVDDGALVGFYVVAGEPPRAELAALFVEPEAIGRGYGRLLWHHAIATARAAGFESVGLDADPGAAPFYAAMGAERIGWSPSGSVPGRHLPRFERRL